MHEIADRILEQVEQGKLGRRDAVARLVAVAAATFVGGTAGAQPTANAAQPTFRSVGLNHIALRVADVSRSRDFYRKHLGLETLQESKHNCFLAAGKNNFVALFRSDRPGLDHYCYTVEGYRAGDVVERLGSVGLESRRVQNRVYFDDPDGIEVQLASEWGDYPRR
ncbi:MAG: hypothetical protein GY716_01320 [bacterium]|nr:hypothetical protein [bacterium]